MPLFGVDQVIYFVISIYFYIIWMQIYLPTHIFRESVNFL